MRTGRWDPARTFSADGLRSETLPDSAGAAATEGMRGTAPTSLGAPAGAAFDALWKREVGGLPQTYDAQTFDAVVLVALAAAAGGSNDSAAIAAKLRAVSEGGVRYTFPNLAGAMRAAAAGKDIDYEGASGPIALDGAGDPAVAAYATWTYRDGAPGGRRHRHPRGPGRLGSRRGRPPRRGQQARRAPLHRAARGRRGDGADPRRRPPRGKRAATASPPGSSSSRATAAAAVARAVYAPGQRARRRAWSVVLVVSPGGSLVDFDAGRAAQSMMLAGWAEGVASCPNGVADRGGPRTRALGIDAARARGGRDLVRRAGPPAATPPAARRSEWSARANRLPLDARSCSGSSEPRG